MAGRRRNKLAVILCVFCLSYGMLSGASYARGDNLEDEGSTVQEEESQTAVNTTEESSSTEAPVTTEEPTTTEESDSNETPATQPKSYTVQTGIADEVVLVPEKTVTTTAADNRDSIPCMELRPKYLCIAST